MVQICGKESHGLLHNEHVDLFIKVLSSYQGLNPVTHKNKCGFVLITWKKRTHCLNEFSTNLTHAYVVYKSTSEYIKPLVAGAPGAGEGSGMTCA